MKAYLSPEDEPAGVVAAIAEASDDAIITKDLDGIIRSWNPAAERLYGYAAADILGQSVSLILPPERASELESILERIRNGQRVERHETVRHAKDGHLVEVYSYRQNGQKIGALRLTDGAVSSIE